MALSPEVTGAAIGSAGGILGSIVGSVSSAIQNNKARRFALEDWHRQNAYNHPSAQMARLREAGLNPNLVYGTGTQAATGQATRGSNVAQFQPKPLPIGEGITQGVSGGLSGYYDVQIKQAQIDNLRTQNTLIASQAALANQKTAESIVNAEKLKAGTSQTQWLLERSKGMYGTQMQIMEENLRNLAARTGQSIAQTGYINDETLRRDAMLNEQFKNFASQRAVNAQRIENMIIEKAKIRAETEGRTINTTYLRYQMAGQAIQNQILAIERQLKEFGNDTKEWDKALQSIQSISNSLDKVGNNNPIPVPPKYPKRPR